MRLASIKGNVIGITKKGVGQSKSRLRLCFLVLLSRFSSNLFWLNFAAVLLFMFRTFCQTRNDDM